MDEIKCARGEGKKGSSLGANLQGSDFSKTQKISRRNN